ncbi:MAG: O-antigen ligase family protein [Microgenomates group bacterium]
MDFIFILIFLEEVFFGLNNHYLSTTLILFLLVNFYFNKNKNLSIKIPNILGFSFLIFIVSFFTSFFYSVDKKTSLISLIDYICLFLISLYAFNFKQEIIKILKKNITLIILFSILFFLINLFYPNKFFPPTSLIWTYGHSQLANFFIIPYLLNNNLIFLFLIILSLSRSALFSIIFVYFFKLIKGYRKNKISSKDIYFLILLTGCLLIISFFYKKDNFLGNRLNYFIQVVNFLFSNPLKAVGLGNVGEVSLQMAQSRSELSISSHNFFLDLVSEIGVFILIPFLLIYHKIFKEFFLSEKDKKLFYLFFGLTGISLFDFSFKYTSFKLIYFMLLGLLIKDKAEFRLNPKYVVYPIYSVFTLIILSDIFVNLGYFKLAFIMNPFNNLVLEKYLNNEKNKSLINNKLEKYWYFLKNDDEEELNYLIYQKKLNRDEKVMEHFYNLIYKYPAYYLDYLPGYIKLLEEKDSKIDYGSIEKLLNNISKKYFLKNKNSEVFKKLRFYCNRFELSCYNLGI